MEVDESGSSFVNTSADSRAAAAEAAAVAETIES